MYIATGDQLGDDIPKADMQNLSNSVIVTNNNIITKVYAVSYNEYNSQIWRTNLEIQRHWAASFLLPAGSMFTLAIVVLLMILFKRHPHIVTAIVAAILGIIIILTTVISLNRGPVYN